MTLFPFSEYWWCYGAFAGGVLVLLALDLGVFHRHAHAVGFREAAAWSAAWVALAVGFGVALYYYSASRFAQDPRLIALPDFDARGAAWQSALEFFTGYVVEYSLSIDNVFVFVLVFRYFSVPAAYQHRVLFYGILGALVFRAVFIALGAALMQFRWVVWVFGAFLIFTGAKLLFGPDRGLEPERNPVVRLCRKLLPITTAMDGGRFFARVGEALHATPLFVALLVLEVTDVVFAIDSVPAIYALTDEPLIVFTSNVFAILGLRSMYFFLGGAADRFPLLRYGLALVLIFVGVKMVWLNEWYGGKFPIAVSLAVIGVVIAASILPSLVVARRRGGAARHVSPR